jgi:hypothetical protein
MKKGYDVSKDIDGDARIVFNQYLSAHYAKKVISKWPDHLKLSIFFWYECCRNKMMASIDEIFSGGSGEPAKYGLVSVMRAIAEGGIYGDFDKVQRMYVKMWVMELDEKEEEYKRIIKDMKQ